MGSDLFTNNLHKLDIMYIHTHSKNNSLNEHKTNHGKDFALFQHYAMLFQFNVLTLGQLNLLRLIQLIYYGWAQLILIVSAQLVCTVLDQLIL